MLDKLKELLLNWKVSVALVGGAIVVATAFGTCTFEPAEVEAPADEEGVESEVEGAEEASTTETNTATTESNEGADTPEATTE